MFRLKSPEGSCKIDLLVVWSFWAEYLAALRAATRRAVFVLKRNRGRYQLFTVRPLEEQCVLSIVIIVYHIRGKNVKESIEDLLVFSMLHITQSP